MHAWVVVVVTWDANRGYTAKCQTSRSCTSFLWFRGKPRPICFAGPKAQGFQEGQMQREPVSEQDPPPAIRKSSVIREGIKKNRLFLGNSPKQRTPPTHRYGLGLT